MSVKGFRAFLSCIVCKNLRILGGADVAADRWKIVIDA